MRFRKSWFTGFLFCAKIKLWMREEKQFRSRYALWWNLFSEREIWIIGQEEGQSFRPCRREADCIGKFSGAWVRAMRRRFP